MANSPLRNSHSALNYLNEVGVLAAQIESEPLESGNTKREQILQGAMQVFLKQGYAKTSMDRVAATAGVSKQTIYSHFQDKERLFVALIERVTIRSFLSEFQNPFEGEPKIVLRRIAEKFLAKMDDQEYIAFFRLVVAESARFPELAQLYTRTVVQFGFHNLSAYLEAHSELNITDTEATARIFLGSLVAFVLAQEVLYGKQTMPMEKERLISSLINCVLCQA